MAPTCRRCGKAVYFAEEKIALGKKWHKNCVSCKNCNAPLSSSNMTDHDDELYCRSCHGKLFGTKGYGYGGGSAGVLAGTDKTNGDSSKPAKTWNPTGVTSPVASKLGGGGPKCKCGETVYFAEEVVALGRKWHKRCLKCTECKATLSSTNMTDHDDELYCKNCHGRLFGTKGYGYGGGSAGVLAGTHEVNGDSSKPTKTWNSTGVTSPVASKLGGGGAKCPKCEKTVYFAEEMNALGKKWHKWCLKCTNCNKTLDSTTMTDHDDDLYCKSCHGRLFGTKGYGYGGGSAGILTASHESNGDSPKQTKKTWNSTGTTNPLASKLGGGGPKCPKCEKSVYFAEEMNALGKKWHKWCLKCTKCNKRLDSTTMRDHDEELYCKNCHSQLFGTKGYGFGGGSAGILSATYDDTDGTNGFTSPTKTWNATGTTSSVALKLGGGQDKCGHCGQTVYFAEKLIGGEGKIYHKACFKCSSCKKQLDSTTVLDHERELFCKSCYGIHFGPKGYGFGAGAGTLTLTE